MSKTSLNVKLTNGITPRAPDGADESVDLACKNPSKWSSFDLLTFSWMNRSVRPCVRRATTRAVGLLMTLELHEKFCELLLLPVLFLSALAPKLTNTFNY